MSFSIGQVRTITEANIREATIGKQERLAKAAGRTPEETTTDELVTLVADLSRDIAELANKKDERSIALIEEKVAQLERMADILDGTFGNFTLIKKVSFKDVRDGFDPHPSIVFTVGEGRSSHTMVLQLDSNKLARNRDEAKDGAQTTQEENLDNSRHEGKKLQFVSNNEGSAICNEALRLARQEGIKLRTINVDREHQGGMGLLCTNRTRKGQRIKQAALNAGLGEEIAELLYKLTAESIRTAKTGKHDELTIDESGSLSTFFFWPVGSCRNGFASSTAFAGAAFKELK